MDQIISIGSIGSGLSTDKTSKTQDTQKNVPSFKDTLSSFMQDVNSMQNKADESIKKMAAGEITDVHQVMTAVEEASTAFNMMMEIRNKVMDAYQEVLRMRL
jgi:flagellar hook-basal body complex protein FliE